MDAFTIDTTTRTLTPNELHTAADDLRNAALVVYYAGHGKGAMVCRKTGMVCAQGAIELATARKMQTSDFPYGKVFWHTGLTTLDPIVCTAEWNRAEAATLVLSEVIPRHLCVDCLHQDEPWQAITHYNDNHCASGTVLYRLLRQAAEHADQEAETRRLP